MNYFKRKQLNPSQIILISFLLLIISGTAMLMLPISSKTMTPTPFMTSLFTAVSATCVTGLVLVDTATHWSLFGQMIILLLIQIGGMGVVTMAISIALFTGRKISFRQRWIMQESVSAPQVGGILRHTRFILKITFMMELLGAFLLAFRFVPQFGLFKGLWFSLFHSISAFCNAGFDLMGRGAPFSSLTNYLSDPLVVFVISSLIIFGGLGFLTWKDIETHHFNFKQYSLSSKLIIRTTLFLVSASFAYFFFIELNEFEFSDRLLASWFQAVTPRTAGFNTLDQTLLSESGILITIILMLIGGSPGSTAGGFKTTTLAILVLSVQSFFVHRSNPQAYGRRISMDSLHNASSIFMLYLVLFTTSALVITHLEHIPLLSALYETASAIGTVGLTMGITPSLSTLSQIILIGLMIFGRVGGLTIIYAVFSGSSSNVLQYPQEKVSVG